MTIYLLRHGESEGNKAGIFSGVSDHALTALGREQARASGRQLASHRFARVITSTLARAVETADLFLETAGLRDHAREARSELNERDFGCLEGTPWPTDAAKETDACWRASFDIDFVPAGGESMRQTHARAVEFLARHLRPISAEGDILVVGHGNVLRSMTLDYLGWPLDLLTRMPSQNCLVTRLYPGHGADGP